MERPTEEDALGSGDVRNLLNTDQRWSEVLTTYNTLSTEMPVPRTGGKIYLDALIDVSDSMEGKKLIAVKLGLCALISNLHDDDEVNITSFSHQRTNLTNGFRGVGGLRENLPNLLTRLLENGSTACYDAIKESLEGLRRQQSSVNATTCHPSSEDKYVVVCLTDGDDNCSRADSAFIERFLCRPGINNFMFVLVAVDMLPRQEAKFRRWFDLRHCKQVSVNVHSGATLSSVLGETLLARLLSSEVTGPRFLQDGGEPVLEGDASVEELRQDLLRQLDDAGIHRPVVDGDASTFNYLVRTSSAAVSRANSVDGDTFEDTHQRDLDVDADLLSLFRHDGIRRELDEDGFEHYDPAQFEDGYIIQAPPRSGTPVPSVDGVAVSLSAVEPSVDDDGNSYPAEFYCPITVSEY